MHLDHFIIDLTTHMNFSKSYNKTNERSLKSNFDCYNFYSEKINWEHVDKQLADINWPEILDAYMIQIQMNNTKYFLKNVYKSLKKFTIEKTTQKTIVYPWGPSYLNEKTKKTC